MHMYKNRQQRFVAGEHDHRLRRRQLQLEAIRGHHRHLHATRTPNQTSRWWHPTAQGVVASALGVAGLGAAGMGVYTLLRGGRSQGGRGLLNEVRGEFDRMTSKQTNTAGIAQIMDGLEQQLDPVSWSSNFTPEKVSKHIYGMVDLRLPADMDLLDSDNATANVCSKSQKTILARLEQLPVAAKREMMMDMTNLNILESALLKPRSAYRPESTEGYANGSLEHQIEAAAKDHRPPLLRNAQFDIHKWLQLDHITRKYGPSDRKLIHVVPLEARKHSFAKPPREALQALRMHATPLRREDPVNTKRWTTIHDKLNQLFEEGCWIDLVPAATTSDEGLPSWMSQLL